jgi:glycerophosphoryl diester phosphodiesterase
MSRGMPQKPLRVAHRGAPRVAIENTLRSIQIAERAGAAATEFDVRATRDGVPVLLHDRTLERFWGDPRAVGDVPLEELRGLTARSPDGGVDRIPTFEEVLDGTRGVLVVDVKADTMLSAIDALITARGQYDRIVFNGGPPMAEAVRRAIPSARVLMSWSKPELPPDDLLERVAPFAINLEWTDANGAAVPQYQARGLEVWCWTVDDAESARRARRAGVDAIISNDLPAIAPGLEA